MPNFQGITYGRKGCQVRKWLYRDAQVDRWCENVSDLLVSVASVCLSINTITRELLEIS